MKLYYFCIRGGDPFDFLAPNNPSIQHDGRMTFGHLLLQEASAEEVSRVLATGGGSVLLRLEEEQTADQKVERGALLGMESYGVFRTLRCPTCFFFDPLAERACGVDDWDADMVVAAQETHPKAADDYSRCPERT